MGSDSARRGERRLAGVLVAAPCGRRSRSRSPLRAMQLASYHPVVVCSAEADTSSEASEIACALRLPDGSALAYRISRARSGAPAGTLVLLHGLASNLTRWTEFVEQTTLRPTWDIVRVDLHGHGGSFIRGAIGIEHWCRDLLAVLDREGCDCALLAGHSLGANIAIGFAARHPARVGGLALIDPVLPDAVRAVPRWLRSLLPLLRVLSGAVRLLNRLGLHRGDLPHRDLRRLDEEMRSRLLAAGKQTEFVRRYSSPTADLKYFPTANYLQELVEMLRPLPPLDAPGVPLLVLLLKAAALAATDAAMTMASPRSPGSRRTLSIPWTGFTGSRRSTRRAAWCSGTQWGPARRCSPPRGAPMWPRSSACPRLPIRRKPCVDGSHSAMCRTL